MSRQQLMLMGILPIVAGLLLRYLIGRCQFHRRGVAGLQRFSGCRQAIIGLAVQRFGIVAANVAILLGIAVLVRYFFVP